jgi:YidC/Oxa1 family membrane protein insertase
MSNLKNLFLTILLSTVVLISWQYFYENPRKQEAFKIAKAKEDTRILKEQEESKLVESNLYKAQQQDNEIEAGFVNVKTDKLEGIISLKGLRFKNTYLVKYYETINPGSKNVSVFTDEKDGVYFSEFGWLTDDNTMQMPNSDTIWQTDNNTLTVDSPIRLTWKNEQGVTFCVDLAVDTEYLFTIKQTIINNSSNTIKILPYALIHKSLQEITKPFMILHEGLIGVFNGILKEVTYEDALKEKVEKFDSSPRGWIGIADKYWLTSLVPDLKHNFKARFTGKKDASNSSFQVDYTGEQYTLNVNEQINSTSYLFVGPKLYSILDNYESKLGIKLFDRAIDYGWFYFLTKPLFKLLSYLNSICGNYGVAILLMTLIVKVALFPIANKSFKSMNKMKQLNPELTRLKDLYPNDKIKLNQEIMELYKREKVNPLSGCLPILIQIPVFFSLYKVIFISIEMRQAPFFGWIKDLSVPDPTSFMNLFGLLPWEAPDLLHIGILPIIMGITMFLQQRMNPEPADPVQAKIMKFLPLVFIFIFYTFPSGLMIYWSFSNILSIIQQWLIKRTSERTESK